MREASAFQTARWVERAHVEGGAKLAVDAHEQVPVERRGHAERIVVGQQQIAFGLDEVGADQQGVARHAARGGWSRETPRRRADRSCRCSIRGRARRTARRAGASRRRAAGRPRSAPRASRRRDRALRRPTGRRWQAPRRTRPPDRCVAAAGRGRVAAQPEQQIELVAVAAAELDQSIRASGGGEDLRAVRVNQPPLGPRDRIPRQLADGVEQRRAERVVERARRELTRRLRQVIANIGGERARPPRCPAPSRPVASHALLARSGTSRRHTDSAA